MDSLKAAAVLLFTPAFAFAQFDSLPPDVRQTARIVGVARPIAEFEALCSQPPSTERSLRMLMLRQDVIGSLLDADLGVSAVLGEIEAEQAEIQDTTNQLTARRNRSVSLLTLAGTIAGGGIGVLGNALAISNPDSSRGDVVSLSAGAAATLLSLVGFRMQRSNRIGVNIQTNMLAPVLRQPPAPAGGYPEEVWRYLNSVPDHAPATRLELLRQKWVREGRIGAQPSPRQAEKMENLTTPLSGTKKVNMSDLSDRVAMLTQLRVVVRGMQADVAALMHHLRAAGWGEQGR